MSAGLHAQNARRGVLREWRDVDRCDHLLTLHLAEAVQRFGAAALSVIDLPALTGSAIEPAQLRVVATLFWAKEVDDAGLIDFVDALAEGTVTGRLLLPLESGASRLAEYWRGRNQRFTRTERRALYARVFGDPRGPGDDASALAQLMTILAGIGTTLDNGPRVLAQLGVVALEVAEQLTERSSGITAWAARDIIEQIRTSLGLLEDRDIAGALGGLGNAWTLIRLQSPMVLGQPVDPSPHLERARAGLAILTWLAESSGSLSAESVKVNPNDPVVHAAATWQAVSGHA
jgi:hypothetical protein